MRAFVAIELSQAVREALGRAIDKLRPAADDVRWVKPDNLHLTLKFLGEVPDERLAEVIELAASCAAAARAFELNVAGTGAFPSARRPRVVFAEAAERPEGLGELALALNRAMTRVDVPFEDRPFRRHITLGRVRRPRQNPALAAALEKLRATEFGTMEIDRMTLIKSNLTPHGAVYTPLERIELGPTASGAA
jgi:2'-5' RNA ligase